MALTCLFRRSFLRLFLTAIIYFAWIFVIHQTLFANRRFSMVQLSESNGETVYTMDGVYTARTSETVRSVPTLVVIQSYQRSGSSFFGDMFNNNPDVFYQFEPLDALYSHLYGTDFSWNVPTDIYYYENGTRRNISDVDVDHVVKHLRNVLHCRTDDLPTSTLIHHFLKTMPEQFIQISPYIKCMQNATRNNKCPRDSLTRFCGKRYGFVNETRRATCRTLLHNPHDPHTSERITDSERQGFRSYDHCMHDVRQILEASCLDQLTPVCESKPIRAAKLVRANMRSMEKLLESEPNLYVIHLLRDPRGVAMSRVNLHDAVKGYYSIEANQNESEMLVREAKMYCSLALDDVIASKELDKRFSGRILNVIYEDFVRDVAKNIRRVYDFIQRPLSNETFDLIYSRISAQSNRRKKEINEVTTPARTTPKYLGNILRRLKSVKDKEGSSPLQEPTAAPSEDIAKKWQEKLPRVVSDRIVQSCKEFYENVNFDWELR